MPLSYKAQVLVRNEYCNNSLRFATETEAQAYGDNLFDRWTQAEGIRVQPTEDPVTAAWIDAGLQLLPDAPLYAIAA